MPRILTHNWRWKLASLVLAAALWILVIGDGERSTIRYVPVEVRLSGIPAPGFEIKSRRTLPDRVRISGPKSRLEAISSAQTDYVDIAGRSASLETTVNASVPDPRVKLESGLVAVRITIEKGTRLPGE
jgi:YbbR domain-containing protein